MIDGPIYSLGEKDGKTEGKKRRGKQREIMRQEEQGEKMMEKKMEEDLDGGIEKGSVYRCECEEVMEQKEIKQTGRKSLKDVGGVKTIKIKMVPLAGREQQRGRLNGKREREKGF